MEALPPGADAWRWVPELAVPRTALGAAALDGCLFALGGQARHACTHHRTGAPSALWRQDIGYGAKEGKGESALSEAVLCMPGSVSPTWPRRAPRGAPLPGATLVLSVTLIWWKRQ